MRNIPPRKIPLGVAAFCWERESFENARDKDNQWWRGTSFVQVVLFWERVATKLMEWQRRVWLYTRNAQQLKWSPPPSCELCELRRERTMRTVVHGKHDVDEVAFVFRDDSHLTTWIAKKAGHNGIRGENNTTSAATRSQATWRKIVRQLTKARKNSPTWMQSMHHIFAPKMTRQQGRHLGHFLCQVRELEDACQPTLPPRPRRPRHLWKRKAERKWKVNKNTKGNHQQKM